MEKQSRFRSVVVWGSIVAFILPILGHFDLYNRAGITQENIKLLIDALFFILVSFGILNDPTNKKGF